MRARLPLLDRDSSWAMEGLPQKKCRTQCASFELFWIPSETFLPLRPRGIGSTNWLVRTDREPFLDWCLKSTFNGDDRHSFLFWPTARFFQKKKPWALRFFRIARLCRGQD